MTMDRIKTFALGCAELGSLMAFMGALVLWAEAMARV